MTGRENPAIISDLGRKLGQEVTDVIGRKTDLVDHPEDKLDLARVACEAALGVSAAAWAMARGVTVTDAESMECAARAAFENLRERWVIAVLEERAHGR